MPHQGFKPTTHLGGFFMPISGEGMGGKVGEWG